MILRNFSRLLALFILVAIIVLTVVPAGIRPSTPMPRILEHAGIFLAAGIAFAFGYPGREWLLSAGAIFFCAGIELAQLPIEGRHARLSDLLVDTVAALAGLCLASILTMRFLSSGYVHEKVAKGPKVFR